MLWTGKWQAVRALHGIDPSTTDPRLLCLGYIDTHTNIYSKLFTLITHLLVHFDGSHPEKKVLMLSVPDLSFFSLCGHFCRTSFKFGGLFQLLFVD